MFAKQTFKRTTLISIFLCALLAGLFVSKLTAPLATTWLLVAGALSPLLLKKTARTVAAIILIGVIIGWWRGGLLQTQLMPYQDLYFQNVTLVGRATEDGVYANNGQLSFTVENSSVKGQQLPGKIKVSGYGSAYINRHDIVSARGKLYPNRGGKQANVSFAEIDVLARATSPVETFRKNFIAGMETALPEPAASFGVGLLVGQRSLLPDDVALALTLAGLTHIVAVSGYNLTIIVRGVTRSMKRFSRFQILVSALSLIYLFILVTGFSPSIVRAGFVSGLSLLAWYFGRNLKPSLLILLVAAGTAFVNPLYVWGDIGWYLSFLAFTGVLILAPLLVRLFAKKSEDDIPLLGAVMVESFAAQLLTLPLIMFIFARFSLVGLLANVVVVPMVPFAMLFSLVAGLAGMWVPVISGWLALPARLLLNLMLWFADIFAKIPHANLPVAISAAGMAVLYVIIMLIILGLKRRTQSVTIGKSTNL